ncbi:SMI1/KNR4 family protein [Streptomyces olivochromogenes]|uniref:SMI1/KNR4 family protein n=1 Tax=Streptomyces olivochromogenes TaxID=1963 RepID=A0A250VSF7_STROL|nr:SMI1/KNR4 family protein [Streptomyces olivochromogenes]
MPSIHDFATWEPVLRLLRTADAESVAAPGGYVAGRIGQHGWSLPMPRRRPQPGRALQIEDMQDEFDAVERVRGGDRARSPATTSPATATSGSPSPIGRLGRPRTPTYSPPTASPSSTTGSATGVPALFVLGCQAGRSRSFAQRPESASGPEPGSSSRSATATPSRPPAASPPTQASPQRPGARAPRSAANNLPEEETSSSNGLSFRVRRPGRPRIPGLLRQEDQPGQAPHPGPALPRPTPSRCPLRHAPRRNLL